VKSVKHKIKQFDIVLPKPSAYIVFLSTAEAQMLLNDMGINYPL